MMRTGFYQIVRLQKNKVGELLYAYDVLNRNEAIEAVNRDRKQAPPGTIYRLVELTDRDIQDILGEAED